jgi:ATP synthase protein I
MPPDIRKNRGWPSSLTLVMQFGLTIAGCIVFCFLVGRYLDGLFGIKGVFTVIFIILGVIGGANVAYRQIMKALEEDRKRENPTDNGGKPRKRIAPRR